MSEFILDEIRFDELPEDLRIGIVFVHKSVPVTIEALFRHDLSIDILWHKFYPELNGTTVLVHHPQFPPAEDDELPSYECEIIVYGNGTIAYKYRRINEKE